MTQPLRPLGAGAAFAPEALVRQVLLEGLVLLANDEHRLSELFTRVDTLLQGTQEAWQEDHRAVIRQMLDLGQAGGLRVKIGYPQNIPELPCISIIEESASENTSMAVLGDIQDVQYERTGTVVADPALDDSKVTRHTILGSEWTNNLQLGCWATNGERSVALKEAVHNVMMHDKNRLYAAGIYNVSLSEGGTTVSREVMPRVAYLPFVRVSMDWTRRQTRKDSPVPTRALINTPTFGN